MANAGSIRALVDQRRTAAPPLKVAVVGCGLIGERRAEVARSSGTGEVAIVADVDESRAAALAQEHGCDHTADWQLAVSRDDVEAVVVSTTHRWLAPITIAALQHGKHVLVEKPMARTPAEAEAIVAETRKHPGLRVGVGFNHRHHAALWKAHELLGQGAVGEVMFARCRYGHGGRPGYENEWRADRRLSGGGELLDQGMHAIDLFRWFLGDFADASGFVQTYVWGANDNGHGDNSVEDNAFALFRTAGGRVAELHASWTQWKNLFCFEVFGREGYLVAEGLGGSYGPERLRVGRRRMEGGVPEENVMEFAGTERSWEAEWQEFVAAVREDRDPLASANDGLQAVRMVHAVYQSAAEGRVVKL